MGLTGGYCMVVNINLPVYSSSFLVLPGSFTRPPQAQAHLRFHSGFT